MKLIRKLCLHGRLNSLTAGCAFELGASLGATLGAGNAHGVRGWSRALLLAFSPNQVLTHAARAAAEPPLVRASWLWSAAF